MPEKAIGQGRIAHVRPETAAVYAGLRLGAIFHDVTDYLFTGGGRRSHHHAHHLFQGELFHMVDHTGVHFPILRVGHKLGKNLSNLHILLLLDFLDQLLF